MTIPIARPGTIEKQHSTIKFGKNTVTKAAAPEIIRVEVEKTRRAFEIGKECGLFRVPEVLDYDESKGIAILERIGNIRPFDSAIRPYRSTIERVGCSLAIIHDRLSLPDSMIVPLPVEFDWAGTGVFLHGDFNGCNVCFDTASHSVVILDWQMTPVHGGQATYGSRYFDLLWFINYALWSPKLHYLFCDPVAPMAEIFLCAYFREAGIPFDVQTLVLYAKRFFETKQSGRGRREGWMTRFLLQRSQVLTDKFVGSLPALSLSDIVPKYGNAGAR